LNRLGWKKSVRSNVGLRRLSARVSFLVVVVIQVHSGSK